MSPLGDTDLSVRTRTALLDALQALEPHLEALIVIGAQALYFHTGGFEAAIPEMTKDADLGIDSAQLRDEPRIEAAMEAAGFSKDPRSPQPGSWVNADGIPVDLMVPEAIAGPAASGRRGARLPPHDKGSMRRAAGLEATLVDAEPRRIGSLTPGDTRAFTVRVAGPAALLVAKLHKLGERNDGDHHRLRNKDAHDIYRLLLAVDTPRMAEDVARLLHEPISGKATATAIAHLDTLFAGGPNSTGSAMAARAEVGVGEPDVVAASVAALATDLLADLAARQAPDG